METSFLLGFAFVCSWEVAGILISFLLGLLLRDRTFAVVVVADALVVVADALVVVVVADVMVEVVVLLLDAMAKNI